MPQKKPTKSTPKKSKKTAPLRELAQQAWSDAGLVPAESYEIELRALHELCVRKIKNWKTVKNQQASYIIAEIEHVKNAVSKAMRKIGVKP